MYCEVLFVCVRVAYDADDEERRSLSLCLPEAQSPQQDILPASRETSLLNSGRLDRVGAITSCEHSVKSRQGRGDHFM